MKITWLHQRRSMIYIYQGTPSGTIWMECWGRTMFTSDSQFGIVGSDSSAKIWMLDACLHYLGTDGLVAEKWSHESLWAVTFQLINLCRFPTKKLVDFCSKVTLTNSFLYCPLLDEVSSVYSLSSFQCRLEWFEDHFRRLTKSFVSFSLIFVPLFSNTEACCQYLGVFKATKPVLACSNEELLGFKDWLWIHQSPRWNFMKEVPTSCER